MTWVERYLNAGLTPIPLTVGEKAPPIHSGFQKISPVQQWQDASKEANIGLLCGNGNVVADGDEPRTVDNLRNYLTGLGIYDRLPQVVTANEEHRHLYLRVEGVPDGEYSRNWKSEIGKGELRLSEVYVVAPGSMVNGVPYRFVNGSPETYHDVPVVQWKDLEWMVPTAPTIASVTSVPVRLIRRDIPERASKLFELIRATKKGEPVDIYSSRSEAEAAIVAILILAGWTLKDVFNKIKRAQ